jgi:peptidoglycan hydrolase-like amidase
MLTMARTSRSKNARATPWKAAPLIRVLLAERLSKIEIRVQGPFRLETLAGDLLHRLDASERRWMVRTQNGVPAGLRHAVIVTATADPRAARRVVGRLAAQGYEARIVELGAAQAPNATVRPGRKRYRVVCGSFEDPAAAAELMTHFQNAWRPRLVRERLIPPAGQVEITDASFELDQEVGEGLRIRPEAGGAVTLFRLPCERWPDSPLEDRRFRGDLEFRVDNHGQLAVVNELAVDEWLKGVLPAELETGFPSQAQRAAAVAVRSMALAMLGMRHRNEDWHFCAGGHCFHYSGLTHRDEDCDRAVDESRGEVILCRDEICDAVVHACCGGHGEHKENVWSTPPEAVLRGRPDTAEATTRRVSLAREAAVRNWILNPPADCLCRVTRSQHPALLERSRRTFRWKEVFMRAELEQIVLRKTGVDLGTLYEIVPVKRGVSGRIIELELIGSRHNLRLQKELKIREALAPGRLLSSCFSVHAEQDAEGLPHSFSLCGAGEGHGCGLCQVGAGALAEAGLDCAGILDHYFPGTELIRLYPPTGGPLERT